MRQRSSYPKSFKAQVVQECLQLGATISGVAISHGINANVIRKWMPLYRDQPPAVLTAFEQLSPDQGSLLDDLLDTDIAAIEAELKAVPSAILCPKDRLSPKYWITA